MCKPEIETNYDFETLSSLQFPLEMTSQLYDKINSHFIKVCIPNCLPIQTNCSRKKWEKLMRVHTNTSPGQIYYLAAKHSITKCGRSVVISSPLQVSEILNQPVFYLFVTDKK